VRPILAFLRREHFFQWITIFFRWGAVFLLKIAVLFRWSAVFLPKIAVFFRCIALSGSKGLASAKAGHASAG